MPEIYTAQVRADQLKVGQDMVPSGPNKIPSQVVDHVAKTKWTEFDLYNGEHIRVTNDTLITVQRERPTPEEKAAQELKSALVWMDMQERSAADAVAHARQKMATESYVDSRWMHEVLQAQAVNEIWSRIARVSMNAWLRGEEMTKIEVIRWVQGKVQEELLDYNRYGSRSTSTWSNAVEDISLDAKAKFLRDAKWYLIGV